MVPPRNGSLPDRRHDGFSRAVFGAWHCLLVVLAVVSVIGEGEVEDLSVGRRGNASTIRRGSAGLFPLSSKGGFRVFQGNLEEELEEERVSWERIPRFPWTTRTIASRGWEPLIARPTTRLQSRWIASSERAAHQMGVGLENTGPRLPHTGLHLLTPTLFSYSFRKVTRGSMKKRAHRARLAMRWYPRTPRAGPPVAGLTSPAFQSRCTEVTEPGSNKDMASLGRQHAVHQMGRPFAEVADV